MTTIAPSGSTALTSNRQIADRLAEHADLLEQQGEDGFRTRAYRDAARTVADLPQPVEDIWRAGGQEALIALAAIGKRIAGAIAEMLTSGNWTQHDRLRGALSPERLFQTIPGIGPRIAARLVDTCHFETLEDLETALHLGDQPIDGIGPRRRKAIAALLAQRLGRLGPRHLDSPSSALPAVDLLLQVDALYRSKAAAGTLTNIAPKRFNPSGEAWLPILHARHDDWHFTVLFSNTDRAGPPAWPHARLGRGLFPEGRGRGRALYRRHRNEGAARRTARRSRPRGGECRRLFQTCAVPAGSRSLILPDQHHDANHPPDGARDCRESWRYQGDMLNGGAGKEDRQG